MARGRQRKTTKGDFTKEQMEAGVRLVVEEQMSLRKAAERTGIKFQTLQRYVTKQKTAGIKVSNPTTIRDKTKDSRYWYKHQTYT
ncbi:CENP-B N-terminal DNA-binding domain [Popillia japonica]|uniref:CENP-B N-terminal DNA-binding domain n=1 Tax=Popillia japonica TaxID=7064 RepID=A0AAW1IBM0_POPJA